MADHDRVDSLALSRYLITSLILAWSEHAPIKTGPALATIWLQAAFGGFYVCCAYLFPKIHPLCHFFSHDLIASQLGPSLHELLTTQPVPYREKKRNCSSNSSSIPSSPNSITILARSPNRGPTSLREARKGRKKHQKQHRQRQKKQKSSSRRFKSCPSNLIEARRKFRHCGNFPGPFLSCPVLSCLVACNPPSLEVVCPFADCLPSALPIARWPVLLHHTPSPESPKTHTTTTQSAP